MTNMLENMPSQFKQKNISAICTAIENQLSAVYLAMLTISAAKNIDLCSGKMLDNIGSIIGLTRAEAAKIIKRSSLYLLTDTDYRMVLKCALYSNNNSSAEKDVCTCIYESLGFKIKLLDSASPALITIDAAEALTSEQVTLLNEMPFTRPAGVGYTCVIPVERTIGNNSALFDAIVGDVNTTIIMEGAQ